MLADTMCGVVLSDVTEVFTHPFAQCMTDVLFQTHLTSNTVDNIIGLATATITVSEVSILEYDRYEI